MATPRPTVDLPPSGQGNVVEDIGDILFTASQRDILSPTQLELPASPRRTSSRSSSSRSRVASQNVSASGEPHSPNPEDRVHHDANIPQPQTEHGTSASMAKLEEVWYGTTHVTHSWWEQLEPRKRHARSVAHNDVRESTRKKVARAVAASLGTAADVVHEALYIGVDLLDLAPIPGLSIAAKTLLAIWDAADEVDLNGISCLRLTERCADILISVRHEIERTGNKVGSELSASLATLEESFREVAETIKKQAKRPFLKRYLKRDEIFREISHCDNLLKDAMTLFNVSIQLRILTLVQESNKRQNVDQEEIKELVLAIASGRIPVAPSTRETILTNMKSHEITSTTNRGLEPQYQGSLLLSVDTVAAHALSGETTTPNHESESPHTSALQKLHNIYLGQNSVDAALDLLQLRRIMREALQATSDAEMLQVLQISESEMPDAIRTLRRALDAPVNVDQSHPQALVDPSVMSESDGSCTASQGPIVPLARDTLDSEFMETGIVALNRMSERHSATAPSWAITKYEIVRDEVIGAGAYSWVYKGTWDGRTVAIKILKDFLTPRELFIKEVEIWKTFNHPNVLPLFGASSTQGEPPWFFVSPYIQHGSLLDHLQRVERDRRPPGLGLDLEGHPISAFRLHAPERADSFPVLPHRSPNLARESILPSTSALLTGGFNTVEREWDLFRFMHHITKGMDYLHSQDPPVLHGDLKAANVLVNSKFCALITDFGESQLKTGWNGSTTNAGTFRWQAPELWNGMTQLTSAADIWAFSITCAEILNMGRMPWRNIDDATVQTLVLEQQCRPEIPSTSRFNIQELRDLMYACWHSDPTLRPPFPKICRDLKHIRKAYSSKYSESPQGAPMDLAVSPNDKAPSPSLASIRIPSFVQNTADTLVDDILGEENETVPIGPSNDLPRVDLVIASPVVQAATPGPSASTSRRSTLESPPTSASYAKSEFEHYYVSPQEDEVTSFRNGLKYRLNLQHDFRPLVLLPLWDPSPVDVGAVGYLSKSAGQFITLFNSLKPSKSDNFTIRKLHRLMLPAQHPIATQRFDKRSSSQKAYDLISRSLALPVSTNMSRKCTFPLKKGLEAAHLYTEIMEYRYMALEDTGVPKGWFCENIDTILKVYGSRHQIQKEDVFLVLGEVRTPSYALFVSHSHPEGQAHFNVFANRQHGHPWGAFTFDHTTPVMGSNHHTEHNQVPFDFHSKISEVGDPWETILLSRLRFRPDSVVPTSQ